MPRIPRSFTNKQIMEFVEDHIKTLPEETINNIISFASGTSEADRVAVMQAYKMGLYTGIVNGIVCFSGDTIHGISDIPNDGKWRPVKEN